MAAPQVVAHRLARMAAAGPNPSARDRREITRMVTEKQAAFFESWGAMAAQAVAAQQGLVFSAWKSWWAWPARGLPSGGAWVKQWQSAALGVLGQGLKPVRRKAVANARRLGGSGSKR